METGKKQQQKESRRALAQKKAQRASTINMAIVALVLGGLGYAIYTSSQSTNGTTGLGEEMVSETGIHVDVGTVLEFETNPPNSGVHFNEPLPAGFYETNDEIVLELQQPEGHIVHSLEHGYVAIWYNCSTLSDDECTELKDNIREVYNQMPVEVIAYPWDTSETILSLSSWGKVLELDAFDEDAVIGFIQDNRNHPRSPEPEVP